MITRANVGGPVARCWLKRAFVAIAIVAVTLEWVNTRASMLRVNQFTARPVVLDTYWVFHSMALGLREGRIGQVDLVAVNRHARLKGDNPRADFERTPAGVAPQWVNFYTLDVGYSFIVEAARAMFRSLPDNDLRPLALQFLADAAVVGFVYWMFAQWHPALGLVAAWLYVSNGPFYDLVSFAYYYYWDIPLTFFVLGAMLLAYRRPDEASGWMTLGGLALGFAVWLRGSWWPLSLFLCAVAIWTPQLRRKLVYALVAFALVAVPEIARASHARGQLTFTTRAVWHVALVGLGYYPNAYGLKAEDGAIFELTRRKYGIEFHTQDYWLHDQAAKREFLEIWHHDRSFVIQSFLGRLKESVLSSTQTSVLSFLFMSNVTYRILCLLGFVAMVLRGGDRRMLGVSAAGVYAIYVVLTSVFYFVGLAYDNVPEVTLLVLFVGGIEAAVAAVLRVAHRVARVPSWLEPSEAVLA